jgi:hypothetical protein
MPKEMWEDDARDRFVTFLQKTEGTGYRTVGEDVSVVGGKNFDYLLEPTEVGRVGADLSFQVCAKRASSESVGWRIHRLVMYAVKVPSPSPGLIADMLNSTCLRRPMCGWV